MSDYALQTIEAPEKGSSSLIVKYLWPFGSTSKHTESVDLLFTQSFSVLSIELERLILTAEVSRTALDELEEKLGTIHDILARENVAVSAANDELLAELWTWLGGNRGRVARFANNLQLLKELGGYREAALARVVAALQVCLLSRSQLSACSRHLGRLFKPSLPTWRSCASVPPRPSSLVPIYPWRSTRGPSEMALRG